ncbi:MAG TPA: type II secretion system protein GspM [Methylomirabilota bacterium]|nr:type II secretion system protein GspM [Methylomirabilota bacterium]
MPTLSPRERIVVGAGAAIALVVGGYLMVVEPIMTRARTAEATVPLREEILERRRDQIRQQARLAEELGAVNARLEAESGRLLRGPTAPLAASELQQLVKELLGDASVEVRSERVLPASDLQGLQEVSIELAVMGSIRDTVTALSRLERAPRLLALKDVKIRVVAAGQPRDLLTTVVIAGYLLPGPVPAKPVAARSD